MNRNQASCFLKRTLTRLEPVVPLPNERWYVTVFNNYDMDRDGLIDFKAFREIVEKFHHYHADKNERRAQEFIQLPTQKAADVPQEPGTPVLGFRTQIQFPRDEDDGLAKMLTDYDLVDKSVGKGSFGTVQRVRCRRSSEIFCAKEIKIQE